MGHYKMGHFFTFLKKKNCISERLGEILLSRSWLTAYVNFYRFSIIHGEHPGALCNTAISSEAVLGSAEEGHPCIHNEQT